MFEQQHEEENSAAEEDAENDAHRSKSPSS